LPDTGYGYPVYNIQPDPDFYRIGFVLYSYTATRVQIKDSYIDFLLFSKDKALFCRVAHMTNQPSALYFTAEKQLHMQACLLRV